MILSGVESVVALEASYFQSNPSLFKADTLRDAASLTSLTSFRMRNFSRQVVDKWKGHPKRDFLISYILTHRHRLLQHLSLPILVRARSRVSHKTHELLLVCLPIPVDIQCMSEQQSAHQTYGARSYIKGLEVTPVAERNTKQPGRWSEESMNPWLGLLVHRLYL